MSDSKKKMKDFMAYAPLLGLPTDKDEAKKQWKAFKKNTETFMDHLQDIQKTLIEARKEAWNRVFPKLIAMEQSFADTLPEEVPTAPGMPASPIKPKEIADKVIEFQETANKNAMEQADAAIEIVKKGQEQVKEAVKDAVSTIEEKAE